MEQPQPPDTADKEGKAHALPGMGLYTGVDQGDHSGPEPMDIAETSKQTLPRPEQQTDGHSQGSASVVQQGATPKPGQVGCGLCDLNAGLNPAIALAS